MVGVSTTRLAAANPLSTLQESIEVHLGEDGNVCIAHVDRSGDCCVAIPPEQVDVLISWLDEGRAACNRLAGFPDSPARGAVRRVRVIVAPAGGSSAISPTSP